MRLVDAGLIQGRTRLQSIKAILINELDQQPLQKESPDQLINIDHDNLRGENYYH